jgi:DNA replication protein DnaC
MTIPHRQSFAFISAIADSILDRLIHYAYRIELKGESVRKKRRKPGEEESQ